MNIDRNPTDPPGSREHRAQIFAALGDPTRLGIVELLQVQDLSPDALCAALEVPGNLLAHHVKVLTAAGLVRKVPSQNDRRRTYLQVVDAELHGLLPHPMALTAPRVVFVCTHNSARSVLAEALWRQASEVPSASAGTHPADRINPRARTVAERRGLLLSEHPPRRIEDVLRADDIVVSVCDSVNEALEAMDNPRIHWSIPDPAAVGTDAAFAHAVDDLSDRVTHLASRVTYRRPRQTRRTH